MTYVCRRCHEARAARGSKYCKMCSVIVENLSRAEQPTLFRAITRARQIDAYDVRNARNAWRKWAGQTGDAARESHPDCYRRCVATLDDRRYLPGVVVAVDASGVWV